jgi:hypothetical protein
LARNIRVENNGKKWQSVPVSRNIRRLTGVLGASHFCVEKKVMRKLFLIATATVLLTTGAFAQTTVTTTATGHSAAVQIEPEYRTRIHTYVTEHKIRPVETRERIVVGSPVPRDVDLVAPNGDHRPPNTVTFIPVSA